MTLSSLRPVAAVGLVAAILLYVGCARTYETADPARTALKPVAAPSEPEPKPPTPPISEAEPTVEPVDPAQKPKSATPAPKAAAASPSSSDSSRDPLKKFASWSKTPPAAVLVVSGEQNGYLQPCGCTDGQLGGLGRRYDLIDKLRAKGWPVAAVDLGNLIHDPAGSRGGPQQERIKFDTALKALAAMKYSAVAVGPEDLKLGVGEMLGLLINLKSPLFLSANLKPTEGFEDAVRPSMVLNAGPVKLGVTAVIEPAVYEALADPDKATLLTARKPEEVLPAVLAQLEKDSEIQVLLVQGTPEEAARLAKQFPGFDLVVSTAKFDDPDERPEVVNGGKTTIINVGRKGKYAGVVGLFPGKSPTVTFTLQPLESPSFREAEPMRALIDDNFPSILKMMGVVENFSRTANTQYPEGAEYVGAESCQSCHPNTFAKWSSTKHAKAYNVLTNPKRNREADAECISCHTTGFGYNTGWASAEKTPFLKGNQCENCHGPGSKHNAEPDNIAFRAPMVRTAESADKGGFCISCHNDDNGPHFKFQPYYAQIFHKGLDTYEDPKVHQGQPQPRKVAGR